MFTLAEPPLFTRLRAARRVLIAGAGGGFDVYAGLPLALALVGQGKQVHLANLSFADLSALELRDHVATVRADSPGDVGYFPERTLARWLARRDGIPVEVHAFPRVGPALLRTAYRRLVAEYELDAIVLVDGGTDILMCGDEVGLGTPEEDMSSLCAVAGIEGIERLVVCLGFGIDSYHGVSHADVLENLAALDRDGAYLGALSIPASSAEATAYREAVEHAQTATPARPSIVNGQIAAALRGDFGDVRFTSRTSGSELFVNPLMAMYFAVDLVGLARNVGYLPQLEDLEQMVEVSLAIELYREEAPRRPRRSIPH
ncbi:DUF1152 domain-containing protein [Kribbella sp. NPDC006257]|uniref:DUF1152 domain-containing protein n=1 Tax=Kribbella sp. NPDC006257 TaxID=3156738 RepID=UPI0033A5C59A